MPRVASEVDVGVLLAEAAADARSFE